MRLYVSKVIIGHEEVLWGEGEGILFCIGRRVCSGYIYIYIYMQNIVNLVVKYVLIFLGKNHINVINVIRLFQDGWGGDFF